MPETIKLLGSTESKITKYENGENVLHSEITEFHCNIVSNDYQQDSRVLYTFVYKIKRKPIRIITSYCRKNFKLIRHVSKGNF